MGVKQELKYHEGSDFVDNRMSPRVRNPGFTDLVNCQFPTVKKAQHIPDTAFFKSLTLLGFFCKMGEMKADFKIQVQMFTRLSF